MKPKISVLMSVYNGENFLKESIDSILTQTFSDFEFIIVNDGSNDLTGEILASYKDFRLKIFLIKNTRIICSAKLWLGILFYRVSYEDGRRRYFLSASFRCFA